MRVAAIAGAVVFAFIGVMYLRFSGDGVPGQSAVSPNVSGGPVRVVLQPRDPPRTTVPRKPRETVMPYVPPTPGEYIGTRPPSLEGIPMKTAVLGPGLTFPENTAVLLETLACEGCDERDLVRAFRRGSGSYRGDTLLTLAEVKRAVGISGLSGRDAHVFGQLIATADAKEVVAAICNDADCRGASSNVGPGAELRLFSSVDGGVSWDEFGSLRTPETPVGITTAFGSRDILVSTEQDAVYRLFRAGTRVSAPHPDAQPIFLSDGNLLWGVNGRLLWPSGDLFADFGASVDFVSTAAVSEQGEIAVGWRASSPNVQIGPRNLLILSRNGTPVRGLVFDADFFPAAWWGEDQVLGSLHYSMNGQPAIANVTSGTVSQVDALAFAGRAENVSRVLAVQRAGPYELVRFTEGTCLNIRAEPGPTGQVVGCAQDNVLLRGPLDATKVDGVVWHSVVTPAGVRGWASTEYLEVSQRLHPTD